MSAPGGDWNVRHVLGFYDANGNAPETLAKAGNTTRSVPHARLEGEASLSEFAIRSTGHTLDLSFGAQSEANTVSSGVAAIGPAAETAELVNYENGKRVDPREDSVYEVGPQSKSEDHHEVEHPPIQIQQQDDEQIPLNEDVQIVDSFENDLPALGDRTHEPHLAQEVVRRGVDQSLIAHEADVGMIQPVGQAWSEKQNAAEDRVDLAELLTTSNLAHEEGAHTSGFDENGDWAKKMGTQLGSEVEENSGLQARQAYQDMESAPQPAPEEQIAAFEADDESFFDNTGTTELPGVRETSLALDEKQVAASSEGLMDYLATNKEDANFFENSTSDLYATNMNTQENCDAAFESESAGAQDISEPGESFFSQASSGLQAQIPDPENAAGDAAESSLQQPTSGDVGNALHLQQEADQFQIIKPAQYVSGSAPLTAEDRDIFPPSASNWADRESLALSQGADELHGKTEESFFDNAPNDWINSTTTNASYSKQAPSTDVLEENSLHAKPLESANTADLEDIWAQELRDPVEALDDTWGAAFGDDDEGFLDDLPADVTFSLPTPSISGSSTPAPSAFQPSAVLHNKNSYTASSAIPAITTLSDKPAKPMVFFEDLPIIQPVRSRKPKQQVILTGQPLGAAPPTRPSVPPRTSSATTPYPQFRGPERLEMFPPQPNPSFPTIPTPPSTLPQAYTSSNPLQIIPQPSYSAPPPQVSPMSTRYSPAPVPHSTVTSSSAKSPPPMALGQALSSSPYAPNASATIVVPHTRSPYAPASAVEMSRALSHSHQLPPPQMIVNPSPAPAPYLPQAPSSIPGDVRPAPSRSNSKYAPVTPNPLALAAQFKQPPAPAALRDYSKDIASSGAHLPPANRFAPGTSSPLAPAGQRPHMNRTYTERPPQPLGAPANSAHAKRNSLGDAPYSTAPAHNANILSTNDNLSEMTQGSNRQHRASSPPISQRQTAPRLGDRSTSYAPHYTAQVLADPPNVAAPQRPRTSSPTIVRNNLQMSKDPLDRPSSVQIPSNASLRTVMHNQPSHVPHDNLDFLLPTNEIAMDPLERWKGSPIFRWGSGGLVTTSFPKHIPRYGGGQSAPRIVCAPGEVKVEKIKDILPSEELIRTFPGPLKGKGKKKDVLSWLTARVKTLVQDVQESEIIGSLDVTARARQDEKILLWQVLKAMVEHDGILSANPALVMAVRQTLLAKSGSPTDANAEVDSPSIAAISIPEKNNAKPGALAQIRQSLLQGEREKAIWHAVDNYLWAHAMLIASTTGDAKIWKQVVQEFVRKEMKSMQDENRSVAALYEVFAGNWEESIDQLVPLSARSGFQMISTAQGSSQARDALEGLDKWRETLAMILINRSTGDEQALLSLGKLLAGYGRIEAAHTCYLFARPAAHFGGSDDANTHFAVLGADLAAQDTDPSRDLDVILLSEVYEFALSLAPTTGSSSQYIPHLQAYKLHHAYALAEIGLRNEALQYCDAIASATKSTTRGSPYYHSTLLSQLDDLAKRLSQTPKDGASGWAKPSIGKVSDTVWKRFNSFVAGGDEAENTSTGSANHSDNEAGPFGRLSGGTPTISRSTSMADLYGYPVAATNGPGSQYAPNAYGGLQNSQNSYAQSLYSSSSEQVQKSLDRYPSYETSNPPYGSPPAMPPISRQVSQMSRHQSNEGYPSSLHPSGSYESHRSTIHEGVFTPHNERQSSLVEFPAVIRQNSSYGPSPLGIYGADGQHQDQSQTGVHSDRSMDGYVPVQGGYDPSPAYGENQIAAQDPATAGYQPQPPNQPLQHSSHELPQFGLELQQTSYEPKLSNYESAPSNNIPQTSDNESTVLSYGSPPSNYEPPFSNYESSMGALNPRSPGTGDYDPSGRGYQPFTGYAPPTNYGPSTNGAEPLTGGYEPSTGDYEPPTDGYEPRTGGYEPPTGSYAPPAYQPPEPDTVQDAEVDDEDELTALAAKLKIQDQPPLRGRGEPDEAVRRAMEADAQREAEAKAKKPSGWFGNIFGGKPKEANLASQPVTHKAKLGEELSLVFDETTKKWVNKKDGAPVANTPAAAPPPPRAAGPWVRDPGTPATAGGISTPPMGGSRVGSGVFPFPPAAAGTSPNVGGGSGAATPPQMGLGSVGTLPAAAAIMPLPGSAPPSRPSTGTNMSGESGLDDLLAGPRKAGGTVRKAKKGGARYIDVMAKP